MNDDVVGGFAPHQAHDCIEHGLGMLAEHSNASQLPGFAESFLIVSRSDP